MIQPRRQVHLFVMLMLFASPSLAQLSTEFLDVNGQTRMYLQYLPVDIDPAEEMPLMLCFHGGSGTAEGQLAIGDLRNKADDERFLLVYPQALPDPNDDGSTNWQVVTSGDLPYTLPNPHSDIDFVSSLIDALLEEYNINPARIYAMGYSNGGGFAYDLACRLNNKITGVGAVARTMYTESYAECTVTHPTPVVTILGTADFNSNYNGVTYEGTLYYHSSQSTHDLWIEENGLNPTAEMTAIPDVNAGDNTYVELYQWRDEQNCREVSHYKVIGGGHDWPGTFGNMDIVSHEVIWDHLKAFDLDGRMSCGTSGTAAPLHQEWNLYPNPGTEHVMLELPDFDARATSCQVYNASGQLLENVPITSSRTSIDVSAFPNGVYWLKVRDRTLKMLVH